MSDTWITKFKGSIENFPVEVMVYSEGNDLRVVTEQPETVTTSMFQDGNTTLFPSVISKGSKINLDGSSEQELKLELIEFGFSHNAADTLVAYTRA
jgi:hypothetical protein